MPDKQLLRVEPLNRNDVVEIVDNAVLDGRMQNIKKLYSHRCVIKYENSALIGFF